MQRMKPHKRLILWQKAMDFVSRIYDMTRSFPREEEFGLKSQLRRAAVSIPSNIAEGLARSGKKDRLHFLNVVRGSMSEIDTQIEISHRLGYFAADTSSAALSNLTELEILLSGLVRSLKNRNYKLFHFLTLFYFLTLSLSYFLTLVLTRYFGHQEKVVYSTKEMSVWQHDDVGTTDSLSLTHSG